jgi:hypothetical protein
MTRLALAALAAMATATAPLTILGAQEHDHHHGDQPLGRVNFPVTCKPEANAQFERAAALLHSFWWEEAAAAFRAIAATDSSCGMAYWGLAVTHLGNPFTGRADDLAAGAAAARQAAQLGGATPREQAWIAAVAALYNDHERLTHAQRLRAYSDAMAAVVAAYPADAEAAIFYALSLVATADPADTSYARQRRAAELLNPQFRAQPEHPGLAHYIIHAFDSPRLAELGLEAARRYASIAPSVPHAQHMPSHIFIRLGMWDDNIQANRRSFDAGASYMRRTNNSAVGTHEFHAMDYMVYGYLQLGRDGDALRTIREAEALTSVVPAGQITELYARAAMPARYAMERDAWREAAALPLNGSPMPQALAISHFARGVGAARSGNAAAARAEASALAAIESTLTARREIYWSRVAGIKRRIVESWALWAGGDRNAALALARVAADDEDVLAKHPVTPGEVLPARELEADMLALAGRHRDALRAYESVLGLERNRARAVLGAARAAARAGDRNASRRHYRHYLELMAGAEDRPAIAEARRAG